MILLTCLITPDGTILTSRSTHNYVTYLDKNGETYMLDGGSSYIKTSCNKQPGTLLQITTDSPFEQIRLL